MLRGDNDYPGWGWADVLPHFRAMEGNNRLYNELHGADGPLLVSDPGHIDDMSRWFVQAVQALGEPFNPDFNGPTQRGVGFYQFMNRRGRRSSAAYAFLAPLADNPNLVIRLQSRVRKIEIENGRAVGRHLSRRQGRGAPGLRGWRGHRRGRRAGHAAAADAVRHRPGRSAAGARHRLHRRPARRRREPDRPSGGADHRDGQRAVRLLPAGRRLADAPERPPVQAVRLGPDPLGRRRGRRLRQSDRSERGAHDPGLLRADRLSRPRHARPGRGHLRGDDHHGGGEAEVARLCPAALGRSGRHAAGLAQSAEASRRCPAR